MCTRIPQTRWIPVKRPMGRLDITPLLTSKEFSSQEGLLDFENKKYVASYLYPGRAQLALSIALLFSLWMLVHRGRTPTALPGGCGVTIYLLSQFIIFISFFDHFLRCSCQE